jgi:hypothetical protein
MFVSAPLSMTQVSRQPRKHLGVMHILHVCGGATIHVEERKTVRLFYARILKGWYPRRRNASRSRNKRGRKCVYWKVAETGRERVISMQSFFRCEMNVRNLWSCEEVGCGPVRKGSCVN